MADDQITQGTLLSDCLEIYWLRKERRPTPTSANRRRLQLRIFQQTIQRNALVGDLNAETIETALKRITLSDTTKRYVQECLYALWNFCHVEGVLPDAAPRLPARPPSKTKRARPTWRQSAYWKTQPKEDAVPESSFPASSCRPAEFPAPAVRWPGATTEDIEAAAALKARRRSGVLSQFGCRLEAWASLYVIRQGPFASSTLKGWRMSLAWFNAFCGRSAELQDLGLMNAAESHWFAMGKDSGTVRSVVAKLKAIRRFACELGAAELPADCRHHWKVRRV